jgi:hypothetical protein
MSEQHGPPTITVKVFQPNSTEPTEFTFSKTDKVGDAAGTAAQQLGFQGQLVTFQDKNDRVLDRDKPLVAEHVEEGDELELVDIGGGV